jgi:anion-transporting  ArsA/GET3 family ATPase
LSSAPVVRLFVGAGGVGKTTVAAAVALGLADAGHRTLVMTFDPSRRLQDTLGIGPDAAGVEVPVAGSGGRLHASLLDAGTTFDSLVERYAPDADARDRILGNRYYRHPGSSDQQTSCRCRPATASWTTTRMRA